MHKSIWEATAHEVRFDTLTTDMTADVVIIGGGITGVTTAALLAEAGKSVVLIEAYRVGRGTTGYSTGNLYATVDQHLYALREKWDKDVARSVVGSRRAAIDHIEQRVQQHGIDCDFARQPWHMLVETADKDAEDMVRQEYDALIEAGLTAERVEAAALPLPIKTAVKLENQAQFHPLNYVAGLAQAIESERCKIFENTAALAIDEDTHTVTTLHGTITAQKIVMATHTPKGISVLQTELGPYSEYGVAAPLQGDCPGGAYWSVGKEKHSIRCYRHGERRYIMAIGAKHKTGQAADTTQCYAALENYLRSRFDIGAIEHRWTAQHFRPADGLPFIGHSGSPDVFVATGFATDGLVYGTLAAILIADEINGRKNLWADLYAARRFTPLKSAAEFAKENANVAVQYAKDLFRSLPKTALEAVPPGEGRLIEHDGHKAAVFRADDGILSALSPFCTHMKCVVHWNSAEKTWDCPCHGSRFGTDGRVLEGPALYPLERHDDA